jgi:hypothetical protein
LTGEALAVSYPQTPPVKRRSFFVVTLEENEQAKATLCERTGEIRSEKPFLASHYPGNMVAVWTLSAHRPPSLSL